MASEVVGEVAQGAVRELVQRPALVAGSPCPSCGGRLGVEVEVSAPHYAGGPQQRRRLLRCAACGYCVGAAVPPRYRLIGATSVPCKRGHTLHWAVRRVAGRLDLLCVAPGRDGPCRFRMSLGGQRRQGFLAHGGSPGQLQLTKATILGCLSRLGQGEAAPRGLILHHTGLSAGQVDGALRRLTRGKWPYIARSEPQPLTPSGAGRLYSLTTRGRRWVAWAVERGLLSPDGRPLVRAAAVRVRPGG